MNHRQRLRSLLVERSLSIGDFTLASGARSSWYIDARLTTMSSEGQFLVGIVALQALREHFPTARWVGGLTLGADPVAYAIAHRSWIEGSPVESFTIRKQPKEHGTGRRIEGGLPPGTPTVVIEDTLTRGGSAMEAVRVLEEHGAEVLGVLTVVDREAGGRDRIASGGYPLISLFSAAELLATAGHTPTG